MELVIAYILAVYFGIGAVAIRFINRGKDPVTAREGWIKYFVYLFIVLAMLISMEWKPVYLSVVSLIILVCLVEIITVWLKSEKRKAFTLVFSLLVFSITASGFVFLADQGSPDFQRVLYTIVFSFDGFSQISGQLFGRRQLIARISPGKTVGGLSGGLAAAVITGLLLLPFRNTGSELPVAEPVIIFVIISFLIAAAAFSGDLIASVYKRKNGVKDYSSLIPGHGGMLDRFDSFIAAGAIIGILRLTGIPGIIAPTLFL